MKFAIALLVSWFVFESCLGITLEAYHNAMSRPIVSRASNLENQHHQKQPTKTNNTNTVVFLEESSNLQSRMQHSIRIGSNLALTATTTTITFCRSEIPQEIRRHISRDIAEMQSTQNQMRAVTYSVSVFNQYFIKPFVDLLTRLIVNPLIEACRDVLPWYLTGPIANVLATMAPKPVCASIDAMLGMYMPPLVAIGITKKLVKGLVLVLTSAIVGTIERARSGNSGAMDAGDGGGPQKMIMKEVARRVGTDITNHLMETVPRSTQRALTHTLSTSLSTSVQLYYYCTYCYWFGDYCKLCFYLPDYTWKEGQWWQKGRQERLENQKFATEMQQQTEAITESVSKPLSPVTAPLNTPAGYEQKMTNDLALQRRLDRAKNAGRAQLARYLRRQSMAPKGAKDPEPVSESSVE